MIKPLKYFEENSKNDFIEIICNQQYKDIKDLFPDKLLVCEALNKIDIFSNFLFGEMIWHSFFNNNHYFKNIIKNNMDENKFKSYFIKKEIDLEYDSVYDFEIHYDDYFSESKYIIEKEKYKFKCYGFKDDLDRIVLINDFKSHILFDDKIFLFFGNPGTGKSVTLIATLKYLYEHDTVGTFYIHCKLFNTFFSLYN